MESNQITPETLETYINNHLEHQFGDPYVEIQGNETQFEKIIKGIQTMMDNDHIGDDDYDTFDDLMYLGYCTTVCADAANYVEHVYNNGMMSVHELLYDIQSRGGNVEKIADDFAFGELTNTPYIDTFKLKEGVYIEINGIGEALSEDN